MRWFTDLKIRTKLMAAFGVVVVILGVTGYVGIIQLEDINTQLNTLYERDMIGLSAAQDANVNLIYIGRATANAVLAESVDEVKQHEANIARYLSAMKEALVTAEATTTTESGRAALRRIADALPRYEAALGQTLTLAAAGNRAEALAARARSRTEADVMDAAMTEITETKKTLGKDAYEASDVAYASARRFLIGLVLAGILFSIGLAWWISSMISRPIQLAAERAHSLRTVCITNLGRAAEGMAHGDLTVSVATGTEPMPVHSKDEVGDIVRAINGIIEQTKQTSTSFEAALGQMRDAMRDVRDSADTTASSAQQLQASSEEISSGAQEQASSLEETAASLEQMTASVRQNADSAQQANQLAAGAREVADRGGQVVSEAVDAMAAINTSSKKIADIITTIDEIAFQTNILALNAAVEAARAGQQGRGFAVVAGEVRKLAQRSATAAKEIKGLIQDSVQKVEVGSDLVRRSGESLDEIVHSVKRVTDIVAEIAAASREQSSGIEQVNRAVTQMDSVTQANAGQTEELASTAEALAAQAEQLQALVGRFKVDSAADARSRAAMQAQRARSAAKKPAASPARPAVAHGNGNGNRIAGAFEPEPAFPGLDEFQEY